jgi:hypothetical protein
VKRILLDPSAEIELRQAAAWYRERSRDVAKRVLREVRALRQAIARAPLRFPELLEPAIDPPARRALVNGFPYVLVEKA